MNVHINLHKRDLVPLNQEAYIQRTRHDCRRYGLQWRAHGAVYNDLYVLITAGAAAVPFLLNIPGVPRLVTTVISAAVAVAAALVNFYKFGERRQLYRQLAESLAFELDAFDLLAAGYHGLDKEQAFLRFFDRTQQAYHATVQGFFDIVGVQGHTEDQVDKKAGSTSSSTS